VRLTRRRFVQAAACLALGPPVIASGQAGPLTRPIPRSGEALPAVGLGTWITFNVGDDAAARVRCAAVMKAFVEAGGRLIDSSPMYGSSQEVVGDGLRKEGLAPRVFAADKVWTSSGASGRAQIEESRRRWS
jgi:diketogulonate reductase-like aldo/keto reductase